MRLMPSRVSKALTHFVESLESHWQPDPRTPLGGSLTGNHAANSLTQQLLTTGCEYLAIVEVVEIAAAITAIAITNIIVTIVITKSVKRWALLFAPTVSYSTDMDYKGSHTVASDSDSDIVWWCSTFIFFFGCGRVVDVVVVVVVFAPFPFVDFTLDIHIENCSNACTRTRLPIVATPHLMRQWSTWDTVEQDSHSVSQLVCVCVRMCVFCISIRISERGYVHEYTSWPYANTSIERTYARTHARSAQTSILQSLRLSVTVSENIKLV